MKGSLAHLLFALDLEAGFQLGAGLTPLKDAMILLGVHVHGLFLATAHGHAVLGGRSRLVPLLRLRRVHRGIILGLELVGVAVTHLGRVVVAVLQKGR